MNRQHLLIAAPTAVALGCAGMASMVNAQPIIPNPLVQPAPRTAPPPPDGAQPGAPAGQGAPAQGGRPAAPGGGELPSGLRANAGEPPPSIPLAVQERVNNLYVAAIVDRAAVLRSQLAVPQTVFANSTGISPTTGAAVGGGSAGNAGGTAPNASGSGSGSQGTGLAYQVYRSPSYIVRDGQVVDFVDFHKVLARVTRDTVVLYLLPDDNGDERRAKVVFRGSIDSVIAAPPAPPRTGLDAPGGGIDGAAWRELTNVENRAGSIGGSSNSRSSSSGSTGSSSNSGSTNR